MSSKWQQHWRKKAKRFIYLYICLLLSICFTQSISVRVLKRALGSKHVELLSLRAQTLSEDQLFKKMIERAAAAYKEKRFKDAIQHFERAMMLNPNPNIHWNLAVCYYKVANYQKALSSANAYLENGSPSEKMKRKVEAKKKDILYHLQRAYLAPKVNPNDSQPVAKTEQKRPFISQKPAPIINPEPLDMFEMNPQAIQDEPTQNAPSNSYAPDSYGGASQQSNSSSYGKRNLIIWGSVSAVFLASSIGLHMYGDQVWENRPNGGGTLAQEARRDALLVSWVGDASLVLSLTSLVIGLISYVNDADNRYPQYQTQMGGPQSNSTLGHISFELLSDPNTRQPSANGGLLGWQFTF